MNRLWAAVGVVAVAEALGLTWAYFRPRKPRVPAGERDASVVAGPVENFAPGSVTAFVSGRFYLARLEDGGFLALSRSCTHLNCTVPWLEDENRFVCPCHSSSFDLRGGVIDPPATRALDLYEVAIRNRIVTVDTGKLRKRAAFSSDQVTYPGAA